jgi:hypothetical protein
MRYRKNVLRPSLEHPNAVCATGCLGVCDQTEAPRTASRTSVTSVCTKLPGGPTLARLHEDETTRDGPSLRERPSIRLAQGPSLFFQLEAQSKREATLTSIVQTGYDPPSIDSDGVRPRCSFQRACPQAMVVGCVSREGYQW